MHNFLKQTPSPAPTIGNIVGAYKSVCINKWSLVCKQKGVPLTSTFWQRNYYEHIVRGEGELIK
jgi:putative transposase